MRRTGLETLAMAAGAAALLLAGCSAGDSGPEAASDYKKSVEDPSPEAEKVADRDPRALEIGTIHDPDTSAYCTFTQAGHSFVYDDPESWKFVFLTEDAGDAPSGRAMINGEEVAFEPADETTNDEGIETRHYRSAERGILLELQLRPTASGAEHTNYTGTIAIIEPVQTEKMGIEGSCGV